jgi:hypothetical protein
MTSFTITDVYTSKIGSGGVDEVYTPMVGESYRLTVEYDVTGTPQASYPVSFQMADRFKEIHIFELTPGHKRASAVFFLPLDGEIPWEVEIDPYHYADGVDPIKSPMPYAFPDIYGDGDQGVPIRRLPRTPSSAAKKGVFQPAPPPTSIDFYDPATALLAHNFAVSFNSGGNIDRMVVMMGKPTSESWQNVISASCSVQSGAGSWSLVSISVENPSKYPVYYWDQSQLPLEPVSMVELCELELRNSRVDCNKLRTVTWGALDQARKSQPYTFYSMSEDVIQSNDPVIAGWVHDVLGAGYRRATSPYDAARKLFQSVLAKTTYYYPQPGQKDLRPTNAKDMATQSFGDCGGFSILLVALFRNIGFAARTACGAWVGLDAGHCWCELFFPGHGWMLCDGSSGNSLSESGQYAYYFGNLPDLNIRYAIMRGNTFDVKDVKTSWLQGPWQGLWGTATETKPVKAHTLLLESFKFPTKSATAASDRGGNPPFTSRPELAPRCCPCSGHGGFSPVISRAGATHLAQGQPEVPRKVLRIRRGA